MTPNLILRITARTISSLMFTVSVAKVHSPLVAYSPHTGPHGEPSPKEDSALPEPREPARRTTHAPGAQRPGERTARSRSPDTRLPDLQRPRALTPGGVRSLCFHTDLETPTARIPQAPDGGRPASLICTGAERPRSQRLRGRSTHSRLQFP